MDQKQTRSHQEVLPQAVVTEAGANTSDEYHHHHHHHHRSHQHRRSPQPSDAISGAGLSNGSGLAQTGKPHSTLKARAIMTADKILLAGVQSKWNSIGLPAATAKQPVYGLVNFEQTPQGVHITGQIDGLGRGTSHGFHIHEFGDVSSGCTTAGAHFNPFNHVHGGLNDAQRHVGDLGNVTADANGVAHLNIFNPMMSLHGDHSIVGRAIVVHAMPDDLGRGGNEESTKTGNSGERLACGIIGLTNAKPT